MALPRASEMTTIEGAAGRAPPMARTPAEKAKLDRLVAEAEELMAANAKRLAEFSQTEDAGAPTGAVPVTVWVKPQHAER